jgi:hypothetical protein
LPRFQAIDFPLDLRPVKLTRFRQLNWCFCVHERFARVPKFQQELRRVLIARQVRGNRTDFGLRQFAVQVGLQFQLFLIILHCRSSFFMSTSSDASLRRA